MNLFRPKLTFIDLHHSTLSYHDQKLDILPHCAIVIFISFNALGFGMKSDGNIARINGQPVFLFQYLIDSEKKLENRFDLPAGGLTNSFFLVHFLPKSKKTF